MKSPVRLRAATRGSTLARWQTEHIASMLRAGAGRSVGEVAIEVEAVVVETTGDRRTDAEIWQLGGKGVFVKEVQAAVLDGRADLAVHSAKDLPSVTHPALVIAAVPPRADPRDVLIGATLAGLRPGAVVATGSIRRRAQLSWCRPDLTFTGLRGNIATRLDRIPPAGAIVMAAAAVERLQIDLSVREHEVLSTRLMLPQVAQGALAVECRRDDSATRELLAPVEDPDSRRAVDAERSFLAELGGDCDLPAAAHATVVRGRVAMEAMLASLDGHVVLRAHDDGDDGVAIGRRLAVGLERRSGGEALLLR